MTTRDKINRIIQSLDGHVDRFTAKLEDVLGALLNWIAGIENMVLRVLAFVLLGVVPLVVGVAVSAAVFGIVVAAVSCLVIIGITVDAVQGRTDLFR